MNPTGQSDQIMLVGVSGNVGSFSEVAAYRYFKKKGFKINLVYLLDMDGVLDQLERGKIHRGVFPVLNHNVGVVYQAFQAMGRYEFKLIDYFDLQINHSLMALPDVSQSEIQKIVSHSQAIKQCRNYLRKHFSDVRLEEWIDTAEAAKDLAKGKISKCTGVIALKASAKQYNLKILSENIQDKDLNMTTFVVVESAYASKSSKNSLKALRNGIDSIDRKMVRLLSERNQMSLEIGQYKALQEIDVYSQEREKELEKLHKELAIQSHLDSKYVESLFKIVFEESRRVQKKSKSLDHDKNDKKLTLQSKA